MVEGNHKIDGGELAMFRLLQRKATTDGGVDFPTISLPSALRAIRLAVCVSEDVSVVGFDDIAFGEFNHPPLTTIRLSRAELGQKAFDALFQILRGESNKQGIHCRDSSVVRESTGLSHPRRMPRSLGGVLGA